MNQLIFLTKYDKLIGSPVYQSFALSIRFHINLYKINNIFFIEKLDDYK